MSAGEEKRVHPRLSLEEGHTARFELEGVVFRGVPMTNLSVGGLGLRMEVEESSKLVLGTVLRNLVLEFHFFTPVRVDAEVRHVLGRHADRMSGPLFLGLQYLNPPESLLRQIQAFIEKRMGG